MSYNSFRELLAAIDGYMDEIAPYTVDPNNLLFPPLPLELRELIYHRAVIPPWHIGPLHRYVSDNRHVEPPRGPEWLPSICFVNQATYIDAGLWFIRNTEFEVMYLSCLDCLGKFLDTFPGNQGWATVRRLYLTFFGRCRLLQLEPSRFQNEYLLFLQRCSGIIEVTLKFHVRDLLKMQRPCRGLTLGIDVHTADLLIGLEDLVTMYGMWDIFGAKSLNKVYIDVVSNIHVRSESDMSMVMVDGMPLYNELAEWIRQGFEHRGRDVKVVVRVVTTEASNWPRMLYEWEIPMF